jgi:hypothetical protein
MVSGIQRVTAGHSFNEMDGTGILATVMHTERLPLIKPNVRRWAHSLPAHLCSCVFCPFIRMPIHDSGSIEYELRSDWQLQ